MDSIALLLSNPLSPARPVFAACEPGAPVWGLQTQHGPSCFVLTHRSLPLPKLASADESESPQRQDLMASGREPTRSSWD